MRIPGSLHATAGLALALVITCVLADVKRVDKIETKDLTKQQTNSVQKPTLLNFIRSILPEKTIAQIRNAITSKPKTNRSLKVREDEGRNLSKDKKKTKLTKPVAPVKKVKLTGRSRTAITTPPAKSAKPTTSAKKVAKKSTPKTLKPKRAKQLSPQSRASITVHTDQRSDTPKPSEMEILTFEQKRDRLRQELVKETEDNCLAKILCGSTGKPQEKQKNTIVSDTAYLIKEFFNIFDFTIDEYGEYPTNKDKNLVISDYNRPNKTAERPSNDEEEGEEDEEEDDADDEEDDIFRKSPMDDENQKKYTTSKTKRPITKVQQEPSPQPETSKPASTSPPNLTTRPSRPISVTTLPPNDDVVTAGDLLPKTENRLGRPALSDYLTSTLVSTSIFGSATLKPVDMPFSIPLKTGKDDTDDDDDDEEDDNPRYDDKEDDASTYHRVTLEELVGDIKLSASDLAMLRRGRSMKVSVRNLTSDEFLQSKLRQMNQIRNEFQKLRIADRVGRSMRQSRQCKEFNQNLAQEVLQTCPLTTEVIRFFNSNLKNGTSIEIKKNTPSQNANGAGLVLLNKDVSGAKQAYFVDNGEKVSSVKVTNDLKNPSIPYHEDEDPYSFYEKRPNPYPQNANLNQHGQDITKKPAPAVAVNNKKNEKEEIKENNKDDSDEEQDDEQSDEDDDEEEEDEEEDDVTGRKEEDEDEEADDEGDDDDDEEDEEDEEEGFSQTFNKSKNKQNTKYIQKVSQERPNHHEQIQGSETNQPNVKVVIKPKPPKRTRPGPTLPPGIITVYGVPQPSFDSDFSRLADKIGSKPLAIFGEEDVDRPDYYRRRRLFRASKHAKHDDEEDDNVPYSSRIPKHPPLEPHLHDGDDDDDDDNNQQAFKPHKKNNSVGNRGKPLGGIKGADGDDDDDDDDDDRKNSHKDGDSSEGTLSLSALNEPAFSPTYYTSSGALSQPHNNEYFHYQSPYQSSYQSSHQHQHQHQHHSPGSHHYGYRPIVRPIKIMPDVPLSFRPNREFMRPGRLYPLYQG